MSDLGVLLFGLNDDITRVGNALLRRKAFNKDDKFTTRQSVQLHDQRNLHITAFSKSPFNNSVFDMRINFDFINESKGNSALVLAMEFKSNQIIMWDLVWKVAQRDESFRDLIREKGVILVSGADEFTQAQRDGTNFVTFSEWMAQQGGEVGEFVQLTQGRYLLLNTRGDEDVLVAQCNEFVDMIDRRVLGLTDKDLKLIKFERTTQQQLSDLTQRITELEQKEKANSLKVEKMNQLLKTNQTEVKANMQEIKQHLATTSREAGTKSEDIVKKRSELQENFEREKTERVSALNEGRQRLEATENPLSDLKRKRKE